jgi:hypothetical protein
VLDIKSFIAIERRIPIRKIINDPAIAKDETSIPKMPSSGLPINRKARNIINATTDAFPGSRPPVFDFISRIIGIDPGISIIAKSTMKAARISIILRCIAQIFRAKVAEIMNSLYSIPPLKHPSHFKPSRFIRRYLIY